MTTRQWLLQNDYHDVVDLIDQVAEQWKASGSRTRRNWWEILAGGYNGRPRTVGGITFPVLVSAQKQQRRSITPNAIQRNSNEEIPEKYYHGRSLVYAKKTKKRARRR